MTRTTPRGSAPEAANRGKGDSGGYFRNFSREESFIGKVPENGVEIPFSPDPPAAGGVALREKPFMVRVLRFDPKSKRGDAPVKYLLPLWDDQQVERLISARTDETFMLRDDLHGVDLLCVRQGSLSAGVGARLARDDEHGSDIDRIWRD